MKDEKSNFKDIAELCRSELCKRGQYGSSSDLYVDEKAKVAVIGVQTSASGSGHDTIYLIKEGGEPEAVLNAHFNRGRMWPTGISEDGKKFQYTVKNESGHFEKHECLIN